MSGHKRKLVSIDPGLYRQMHEKEMRERFLAGPRKMEGSGADHPDQKMQPRENLDPARRRKGLLNLALSLSDPFALVDAGEATVMAGEGAENAQKNPVAQRSKRNAREPGVPAERQRHLHVENRRQHELKIPSFHPLSSYDGSSRVEAYQDGRYEQPVLVREKPDDLLNNTPETENARDEGWPQALSILDDLVREALGWQTCEAIDFNGQPAGVEIDVDEWTGGALSRFIETLMNLQTHWKDATPHLGDPQNWIIQAYPELVKQLEEITFQARMNVLQSQLRINTADRAARALATQGYRIKQAGYHGEDLRGAFACTLVHPDGSEVQVRVDPPAHPGAGQALHLYCLDAASHTGYELARRSAEIENALRWSGISSGDWAEGPGDLQPRDHVWQGEEPPTAQGGVHQSVSVHVHSVMEEYENGG